MDTRSKRSHWTARLFGGMKERSTTVVLSVIVLGAVGTGWIIHRIDSQMRMDLLLQAQRVARTVDVNQIGLLSGDTADLAKPAYLSLHKQLSVIRSTISGCRYLYLMGHRPDGKVFFFLDTQDDAEAYSPPCAPGEIYCDASDALQNVFHTRVPFVEGPLPDAWGTWVSALIPLVDPASGAVVAVLGMDMDASSWNWDLTARASIPSGLILLITIGVIGGTLAVSHVV